MKRKTMKPQNAAVAESGIEESVVRLTRDLKEAAATLSTGEARFLVDAYYQVQEYRKAADNQVRSLVQSEEPHAVINWLASQNETLENQIKRALDRWSDANPLGKWAKSITGIGPVIAAGLLAHIDIAKAPTVGHIWRFAGLDPTVTWEKSTKRPWNATLKTLCWKVGESFVKVSNLDDDVYGKVYQQRKQEEALNNDTGKLSQQARDKLARVKIDPKTDAYKWYAGQYPAGSYARWAALEGTEERAKFLSNVRVPPGQGQPMLPPAHIQARAKRYAVKLFLSHFHHVAFELAYNKLPPKPYIIEHGGHIHFIAPPNWKSTIVGDSINN
jgi:hypothetical protein